MITEAELDQVATFLRDDLRERVHNIGTETPEEFVRLYATQDGGLEDLLQCAEMVSAEIRRKIERVVRS